MSLIHQTVLGGRLIPRSPERIERETAQNSTWDGPFVQLAGLFQYAVVDEVSRHFSVGPLIDLVVFDPADPETQPGPATLAIVTVAGAATSVPMLLHVALRSPAGTRSSVMERILHQPQGAASDLISSVDTIQPPFQEEGLYWFEVTIAGRLMTSFPLAVRHD
jgi:hypothetical protein